MLQEGAPKPVAAPRFVLRAKIRMRIGTALAGGSARSNLAAPTILMARGGGDPHSDHGPRSTRPRGVAFVARDLENTASCLHAVLPEAGGDRGSLLVPVCVIAPGTRGWQRGRGAAEAGGAIRPQDLEVPVLRVFLSGRRCPRSSIRMYSSTLWTRMSRRSKRSPAAFCKSTSSQVVG